MASNRRVLINVASLRRRLGQRQIEQFEVELEPQQVITSRTTPSPVSGEVTVESIERGVAVYGHVKFEWVGDCRRCLEPVSEWDTVELDEIFQIHAPAESDIIDFDGTQIDLVPALSDAVGLSLPLAPLCSDDCVGPDPDRYPSTTEAEREAASGDESTRGSPEPNAQLDPRWAALDQLNLES